MSRYFDDTTRSWLKVLASNSLQMLLSLPAGILIARYLGVTDYGYYNIIISIMVIGGAFSELGLTSAASVRIPKVIKCDHYKGIELGAAYFWMRMGYPILFGMLFLMFTFILPPFYTAVTIPLFLVQLALLGMVLRGANDGLKTFFQIDGDFTRYSFLIITGAALTLILVCSLLLFDFLTLTATVLFLLIIKEILVFGIAFHLLPVKWSIRFPSRSALKEGVNELTRSGLWIWGANLAERIGRKLDLFLIPIWFTDIQLGIYALALTLSQRLEIVNHTLYTVLVPRMGTITSPEEQSTILWEGRNRIILVSIGILTIIVLAPLFIPFLYGETYADAVPIFQYLSLAVLLDVFITPALILFFADQNEQLKTAAESIRTSSLAILILILAPMFGLYGFVSARIFATLIYGGYVIYYTFNRLYGSKQ